MKFDLNEVAALLHIHKESMGHPKLKALADASMKHLEGLAEETGKSLEAEKAEQAKKAAEEAQAQALLDVEKPKPESEDTFTEQEPGAAAQRTGRRL